MKLWHSISSYIGRGYVPKFKSGDRVLSKEHGAGFVYSMEAEYSMRDKCFHVGYKCSFDSNKSNLITVHKYSLILHNDGIIARKGWQFGCVPRVSYGQGDGSSSWNEHHRPDGSYLNADKFVPYTGR